MTFRLLVTGSRTWTDSPLIGLHLAEYLDRHPDLLIVHGSCPHGADQTAQRFALIWGVPTERHPADWRQYGRRAGHVRNAHMVSLGAGACLAFIRDRSPGATGCAAMAEAAGIFTVRIEQGRAA